MLLLALVPLVLALVVLSVLGLAGVGPLTGEGRAGRSGLRGGIGPTIGLLVGGGCITLTVIGGLFVVGLSDDAGRDDKTGGPSIAGSARGRPKTGPASSTTATTRPADTRVTAAGPEVTIEADEGTTFPGSYDVADGLVSGTVLRMRVVGFEPFTRAVAEQCTLSVSRRCANQIPVQFDADGEAQFQYLISADIGESRPAPGRCRADAAPCTVVVRSLEAKTYGEIQTIFGDEVPPPGEIEVSQSRELPLAGQTVTVRVRNYPRNVEVTAMLCAAPDAAGPRCGAPGPTAPLVVGRDGTGHAELAVSPGRVGRDRASCSRGDTCGISVASDKVFARAPVVPITFAAPPGAAYDPTRLAIGLGLAALLITIAVGLLLRTDWAAVGEAAAPEIDDAEYADLDAIVAALPPEEDELLPSR